MSDLIDQIFKNIEKMSGIGFMKGLDHRVIGSSKELSRMAGFKNPQDILGKRDEELCWGKYADKYFQDDSRVLKGETIITVEWINDAQEKEHCILVKKAPMIDPDHHKVVGLMGCSELVTQKDFLRKFHHFKDLDLVNRFFEAPTTYEFKHSIEGLTKAQFKVLFYYLRGFSIQELADLLCRSPRTIETHLVAIKERLNATNRKEIFEKATKLGLIKYLPVDDF